VDWEAVSAELEREWLDGLSAAEREEGRRLLGEIVADWRREAAGTDDPEGVNRIQRQDLAALAGDLPPLDALRTRAVTRRAEHLGSRTLALGRRVLSGDAGGDEAQAAGRELLAEAEALAPDLQALPDSPHATAARRELGDAVMEALFAVEGKAMSPRLARETPAGAGPGPPSIRP